MRRLWNHKREHYEAQLDRHAFGHPHARVRPRAQLLVASAWHKCGTSEGAPNLEREIHSFCDVRGTTNVSTTRRNWTATCSDIRTRVGAHARNCLWQQRGTDVEPLWATKSGM